MNNVVFSSNDILTPFFAVDEFGKSVKRKKFDYPYNYDGFVQERCGPNEKANSTVWTDRLSQWDHEKCRKLMRKHFQNESDYWNTRSAKQIQDFLCEYFEKPIEVILVMEYCNVSTGYPVWRIDYFSKND